MSDVSVARRAAWQWRYQRKQYARRARSVVVPPLRAHAPALWICSWQRSGSTWLAETLAATRGTRLIYEPANLHDEVFTGERAAATPLPREGDAAIEDVVRALRTNVHGGWVDQLNHCHLERRRVVKDVRALGLAGAVRDRLDDVPIVILVRHPLAVARSVVSLGWTDRDSAAAYQREIEQWVEFHTAAFADARLADAHFVAYESLVAEPTRRLDLLLGYAATFASTWRQINPATLPTEQRSSTDFREARATDDRQEVPASWRTRALATVAAAGLDELYGDSAAPLIDVDAFAAQRRGAT